MRSIRRLWNDESGAETVEYALVLGFMALAAIAGLTAAGSAVTTWWNKLSGTISAVPMN